MCCEIGDESEYESDGEIGELSGDAKFAKF